MASEGQVGQKEMKCILKFKSIFIWASATQVSDVAHGPLVVINIVPCGFSNFLYNHLISYVTRFSIGWEIEVILCHPKKSVCDVYAQTSQNTLAAEL
jgi:hypothetical protein